MKQADTKKQKKYYGHFSSNNGSTYTRTPYLFLNKKEAIKTMRSICKGNVFFGNSGTYDVIDNDNNVIVCKTILR